MRYTCGTCRRGTSQQQRPDDVRRTTSSRQVASSPRMLVYCAAQALHSARHALRAGSKRRVGLRFAMAAVATPAPAAASPDYEALCMRLKEISDLGSVAGASSSSSPLFSARPRSRQRRRTAWLGRADDDAARCCAAARAPGRGACGRRVREGDGCGAGSAAGAAGRHPPGGGVGAGKRAGRDALVQAPRGPVQGLRPARGAPLQRGLPGVGRGPGSQRLVSVCPGAAALGGPEPREVRAHAPGRGRLRRGAGHVRARPHRRPGG